MKRENISGKFRKGLIEINKYEKAIMLNVRLMKLFYTIIVIFNLLIPLKIINGSPTFSISLFNLIAIGIMFYGLLNGIGYFKQDIPFLFVGAARIVQGMYHYLFKSTSFNWYGYLFLIFIDVLFFAFLFLDRRNYAYSEESDDTSDVE